MDLTLKVWRQKNAKAKGHFETYQVKNISSDSSFLEMLDILNEQLIAEGVDPVAVRGNILNLIGLKMSFCLGVFLTPNFQCQIHVN